MSLEEVKATKELERIIKENLQNGVFISSSEVEAQFNKSIEETPLTQSRFQFADAEIQYKEESSALKYNTSLQNIQQDIEDGYDALLTLSKQRAREFERWKVELVNLSKHVASLKSSLQGLLLIQKDTAGYFDTIDENFESLTKIDVSNTDAFVDLDNNYVSIQEDATSNSKINLNDIGISDVKFTVLTRKNLNSHNLMPNSRVEYAFHDISYVWHHRIYMSSFNDPVNTELKVKLGDGPVNFNRMSIELHAPDTNVYTSVHAQYSIDDYNWFDIPATNNPQDLIGKGFMDFEQIEAQYVKLIMTKTAHDSYGANGYVYEFGAKEIAFYTRSYSADESTLISTPLYVLENKEDPTSAKSRFNNIAIEVCEIIPDNTTIDYSISVDSGITWNPISPINRASSTASKTFATGGFTDNETITGGVLDTIRLDFTTSYSYKNVQDRLIDYTIDSAGVQVPHNHIRILRDTGQNDNDILTRESVTGWQFDNEYYTTYVQINNSSGLTIELGDTVAELDNSAVTGSVLMSKGLHKFRTRRANWLKLPDGTTEGTLPVNDILYPYNHKLLIEGFAYTPSFAGEKVYLGVDIYASYVMERVGIFDFEHNVAQDDYGKFAIIDNSATDTISFLVKYNNNVSDFGNENFYISSKTIDNTIDELLLRIILGTQNKDISPILSGYRIKFGN